MDFKLSEDLFNATINFLWVIFTFGYIPHIIFAMIILMAIFFIAIIFSRYRVIKFVVTSKYYFTKGLLYHWLREKFYFSQAYFRTITWTVRDWDSKVWVGIIFVVFIIIMFIYTLISVGMTTGIEVAQARNKTSP